MALLDEVKVALRVTSDAFDTEIEGLIEAAKRDLNRVGVDEALIESDPLAKMAVILFSKSRFGYDNSEASRFEDAYRQTVIDIINSPSAYRGGS